MTSPKPNTISLWVRGSTCEFGGWREANSLFHPSSHAVIVLVIRSCPTLCDPMGCSPSGSSLHGILQARILEWVACPFLRGSSSPRHWICVSSIAGRYFTIWDLGRSKYFITSKIREVSDKTLSRNFSLCTCQYTSVKVPKWASISKERRVIHKNHGTY